MAEGLSLEAGVLTVSDLGAAGRREDESGARLKAVLAEKGWTVAASAVVPDEAAVLQRTLAVWSDEQRLPLIVTTGGTGVGPRDVTPEATRRVLDREVPGLAELMRLEGLKKTPLAALSRSLAGFRGPTLILNLPGSPKGAEESLRAVIDLVPHALSIARGGGHEPVPSDDHDHGR